MALLSDCCGAPIQGEIMGTDEDATGVCSQCKEWSGVSDDDSDGTSQEES